MDETIEQRRQRIARQRLRVARQAANETVEQRHARNMVEIRKAQQIRAQQERRREKTRLANAEKRAARHEATVAEWVRYFEDCSPSDLQFWISKARKPKACQAAIDSLDLSPPTDR